MSHLARVLVARALLRIETAQWVTRGRPHPGQQWFHGWIPVIAPDTDLTSFTVDQLLDAFAAHSRHDVVDEDALRRIDAELARREAPHLDPPNTPQQRRIDELVAKGWTYRDAYAEAHDLNPDDLTRQELAAMVDEQKQPGETRDAVVRRLYAESVHLSYLRAEQWTRGNVLSKAGQAAGVDPISLFSGTRARARKYASEELKRFWDEVEARRTFTEFRATMLGRDRDKAAAKTTKLQGNDKDFGL